MEYNSIIDGEVFGEITVKKSRFIASIKNVSSEEEAAKYIKDKKKEYHDARHNCSCYVIGKGDIEKSSDDGEPSGTAGRPMLDVIKGKGIYNVVVVVTRYFGGVLLGTGGLIRAYQGAVTEALENADILTTESVTVVEVKSDYNNWAKIENLCRSSKYNVDDVEFSDNVKSRIDIPVGEVESFTKSITDISGGKSTFTICEEKETVRK